MSFLLILLLKLGKLLFIAALLRLSKHRKILIVKLLNELSGMHLIYLLLVVVSSCDLFSVLSDNLCKLCLDLSDLLIVCSLVVGICLGVRHQRSNFRLSLLSCSLDSVSVGSGTGADSLTLEVNVTARNVINLNYRTTRGGFSASGLTNKTEYLALLDIEGNVVNCVELALAHGEVLAKILYAKERLTLIILNLFLFFPGSVLIVDLANAESVPEPILAERFPHPCFAEGVPYPFLAEDFPGPLLEEDFPSPLLKEDVPRPFNAEHVTEPNDPAVVGIAGHKVLKSKAYGEVKECK